MTLKKCSSLIGYYIKPGPTGSIYETAKIITIYYQIGPLLLRSEVLRFPLELEIVWGFFYKTFGVSLSLIRLLTGQCCQILHVQHVCSYSVPSREIDVC